NTDPPGKLYFREWLTFGNLRLWLGRNGIVSPFAILSGQQQSQLMIRSVRQWWWLFVLLLFTASVALKLSGSSVGMWAEELSGKYPPQGLLLFKPQPLRTDEWLVWTPAALSQARQNPRFPVENPNLGPGYAPMLLNLPVAYYTTWFRPHLFGFFILDFERGFSFCWLLKIVGIVLAPAWLLRQLGLQSRGLALFSGLWILLSLQCWLSSPTMLPLIL